MRGFVGLMFLAACGSSLEGEGAVAPELDGEPTGEVVDNPYGPAASCPAFETGTVSMQVGGLARSLEVELPDDPVGAPVVFVWHWLGGTANQTLDLLPMRDLADEGYIVVAPESTGLLFEWDFLDPSERNVDLALFDAVLPCVFDQHAIDSERVYATGMSAGGLMTTFLTMHRAEYLTATAPFSGGAGDADYDTPQWEIPVMVTWGGAADSYGGYDFAGASKTFVRRLEADGSFAVACEHTLGHTPPPEAVQMVATFFDAHQGHSSSPWLGTGLPSGLPGWCE